MSELLQSDDNSIQLLNEQEQDLELIAHVLSFGDMLIAATGPNNSGKTTLAYALMHNHDNIHDTLFIEASLELSFHSVLRRLADSMLIQVPDDDSEAIESITIEAASRAQQKRPFLLVIDQAEQIDAQTLNDIARLALKAQNGIYFALFGLTDFEHTFNGGPTQAALHLQPLSPLSDDSAQQLIAQVFNGDTDILTEEQIAAINHKADGLPGQIISFAADSILAQENNRQKKTAASGGIKLIPVLALTMAVALLLLGFFYQGELFPTKQQPTPETQDVLHGLSLSENTNTEVASDLNFTDDSNLVSNESNEAKPTSDQQETQSDAKPSQAQPDDVMGEDSTDAEQPVALADKPNTKAAEKPVAKVVEKVTEKSAEISAEKAVEKPLENPTEKMAEKPVKKQTEKPAEDVAKTQPSNSEDKTASKPLETAKTKAPVAKKGLPKTDSEKLLAIKQGFIIQLFGSYSQANANKYRANWQSRIGTPLYQYQTKHNGRAWYVVVTGAFKNRSEAKQTIQTWPKEIQKDSPWVRNIKVVHPILR